MLSVRKFGLWKHLLASLALLLAIPLAAVAQVTTATIVGTITDQSGAILPSAQVTARNVDTGLTRTVLSGEEGTYRLEFLPVGNYVIEVTANGLKKFSRSGIVLQVNDTARVDVTLTVGQVSETVNVTEAPRSARSLAAAIPLRAAPTTVTRLPSTENDLTATSASPD